MKHSAARRHLNPAIITFTKSAMLTIIVGLVYFRIVLWLVGIDL